jgi:hypothetical protein
MTTEQEISKTVKPLREAERHRGRKEARPIPSAKPAAPAPREDARLCVNCHHWRTETGSIFGQCHRFPPVVPSNVGHGPWSFPQTRSDDECGEYLATE